jgi:hypothetical protein
MTVAYPSWEATMTSFEYQDLLPTGKDETPYRLITTEHVSTFEAAGKTFLQVEPEALTLLTREAMRDIAHLLGRGTSRSSRRSSKTRRPRPTIASWRSTC